MSSKSKPSRLSMINHAAGIFADMSVDGPAIGTLVAVIDRAKNLPNRKTMGKQNPYCAARLGKEAKKTETDLRGGQTPKWLVKVLEVSSDDILTQSRDQELRFTVHESPDYFRLKVSVFNDDKRTDLIGETWVDLKDLIIPGGSQSDQWHPLQHRGKYAGDIRIEMTYYDTRPEDEAVIERRTHAAEKAHGKSISSAAAANSTPVGSSSLSGPRQLKDIKRRPLASDSSNTPPPARPGPPEKVSSAPVPAYATPPRPMQEHTHSMPPAGEHMRHPPPRHAMAADASYESATAPAPRPMRTYETPDDFNQWNPAPPPLGISKRHPPETHYTSYRGDKPGDPYDAHSYVRPRSGYGNPPPPVDHRSTRQETPVNRPEQQPPEMMMHAPIAEPPRPSSHHSNYSFPTPEHYVPNGEVAMTNCPPSARYASRSSGGASVQDGVEYMAQTPVESDCAYRPHSNSLAHAEYATMQPRVDDDEEDGPPPPPPVHRSGLGSSTHSQLVPSPTPSYHAYSPEFAPSPRTSHEVSRSTPSHHLLADAAARLQDLPRLTSQSSMPPSLVAGFDPAIADAESDRVAHERRASRRQSAILNDDDPFCPPSREPSPARLPPYPVDASSQPPPLEPQQTQALVPRRSFNSDPRVMPRRKSVSPQPLLGEPSTAPQIPFSPDSFDAFNPNAARSAVTRDPAPAYETPAQAMEAARRSEVEAARGPGPIIGDDGREIDPSDHLPTDTWAPEPDRKKKSGVVVRFRKNPAAVAAAAARTSPGPGPPPPPKDYHPAAAPVRPPSSYGPDAAENHRGRPGRAGHNRTYSTPSPRSLRSRSSVSPSPGSHSPSSLYAPGNPGPPIPAKVPIAQPIGQRALMTPGGGPGMDALSRELNTIDIGSVGCTTGRAMRKYVPRSTGYAV
ncbi:hypothetical protein EYZ11_009562 [Aspergillus tanneri]|uniref:C2 domain-containing protein n=1 Tax=Aspergillus tanneri TaxID=1220188 RepID=A0A4S3J7M0_9EURO|nr:hypothetical protein EYZ11_009562 [Aspergillus tanneri]